MDAMHADGWDGMGWDGMGWDGMGWDGMGWDGMGWDGITYGRNHQRYSTAVALVICDMLHGAGLKGGWDQSQSCSLWPTCKPTRASATCKHVHPKPQTILMHGLKADKGTKGLGLSHTPLFFLLVFTGKPTGKKTHPPIFRGILIHYAPEHCLVNVGVPICW